jgi:hypothetical protein
MSAGVFTRSRYTASYAVQTHPIRVQPETIAATTTGATPVTNAAPAGAITIPISAKVTGSNKSLGLSARKVRLIVTGTPPTGYKAGSIVTIPALQPAFFNACTPATPVSYLGTTWEVVSRIAEVTK